MLPVRKACRPDVWCPAVSGRGRPAGRCGAPERQWPAGSPASTQVAPSGPSRTRIPAAARRSRMRSAVAQSWFARGARTSTWPPPAGQGARRVPGAGRRPLAQPDDEGAERRAGVSPRLRAVLTAATRSSIAESRSRQPPTASRTAPLARPAMEAPSSSGISSRSGGAPGRPLEPPWFASACSRTASTDCPSAHSRAASPIASIASRPGREARAPPLDRPSRRQVRPPRPCRPRGSAAARYGCRRPARTRRRERRLQRPQAPFADVAEAGVVGAALRVVVVGDDGGPQAVAAPSRSRPSSQRGSSPTL